MPAESTARNSTKAIEYTLRPTPATSYTPGTRAQASAPYGYNTAMYPPKKEQYPAHKKPKSVCPFRIISDGSGKSVHDDVPPVAIRIPYH